MRYLFEIVKLKPERLQLIGALFELILQRLVFSESQLQLLLFEVKVFWKEQWIGYIPKDMAALIAAEVPEVATGLEAVVTGLTTTSRRDAFRLQISIPIPKAADCGSPEPTSSGW